MWLPILSRDLAGFPGLVDLMSLTNFKFRFIDNEWRLIYKNAEHYLIKMLSKDLINMIWTRRFRKHRQNSQKNNLVELKGLSLSIEANFEGESAYLIKQPRKHLLSLEN